MTLEDFFTLTEMKDGLLALARVEELVSVMKEEKDTVATNIGEAARQWCTVASTLAATENKDSLDHFIKLDGLYFLDHWLQEAQKCYSVTSDSSVEESIIALLGALEKLPIDDEKSVSSGIGVTVKNLFDFKNLKVQGKAKTLFDSWNQRSNKKDADHLVVSKNVRSPYDGIKPFSAAVAVESGCLEDAMVGSLPVEGSDNLVNHFDKSTGGELGHSMCSDSSLLESIKDVKMSSHNTNQDNCQTTLSCVGEEDGLESNPRASSTETNPCQPSLSIVEERSSFTGIGNSSVPMESNVEGRSDFPELKPLSNDERRSQDTRGKTEICSVSASSEHFFPPSDPVNVQHDATQSSTHTNFDVKESELCLKKTLPTDIVSDALASEGKSGMANGGGQKHSRSTMDHEATDRSGGCNSNVLLSRTRSVLRKPEDLETSFSRKEDIGSINSVREVADESILNVARGKDSGTVADVSKSIIDTKVVDKIEKRRSDAELEYGVEDPLEVARQVAKEVEQQVVDYREDFFSTSEKNSGEVAHPGSPDSINAEEQSATEPQNKVSIRENRPCGSPSPNGKNNIMSSELLDKHKDCMRCPETSQATETTQEPVVNTEQSMCNFDLNEEVCFEEMDHPTTPSSPPSGSVASGFAPITVVSASKATAPRLPMAPLHFEGELGWKGSAATSAFRPASLHRTTEAEKSISGSSQSSKQRQDFRDIDLNIAEGDNGGVTDPVLSKPTPASSDLLSRESSFEVSSRRERLKLDLNRAGDNEETPSDWKMEGLFSHRRNGHHSQSPASSSSSRPSSSMRNIDLNDNPSFFDHSNDQRPDLSKALTMNAHGGVKLDDPVISIMGTRVEVNKMEVLPQTRSFLPNGQSPEFSSAADFVRAGGGAGMRSTMTYMPSPPIFGYNGLTAAGTSVSLSQGMYGPGSVHYMVDSNGTPVVPQVMGSSVAATPNYSRPHFLMNSTISHVSGLNGVVTTRPNFDLNCGMTMVDAADNREPPGGFRQLFIPGQGVVMEEQMRSSSSSQTMGGMKRKEPDGGWDLYSVGCKQKAPWQ